MTIIKKYCEKCKKQIKKDNGFYISLTERANRENRENVFLCQKCINKLEKWIQTK